MTASNPRAATSLKIAGYQPRPLRALPIMEVGDWLLKPYVISYERDEDGRPSVSKSLQQAGQSEAVRHLRTAKLTDPSYGVGFLVLHRSLSGTWLLTGWWAYDNILCTQLSNAPADDVVFASYNGPIRACIYELAVVEHERRAWIETMMSGRPDRTAWAAKRLADDAC